MNLSIISTLYEGFYKVIFKITVRVLRRLYHYHIKVT